MGIIEEIKLKAKGCNKRIILPESEDERILRAAAIVIEKGYATPVIFGEEKALKQNAGKLGISLTGAEFISPENAKNFRKYVSLYSKKTGTPKKTAEYIARQPLIFSALALASGDVDGMVAGAISTSGDVIAVSKRIIGLQEGISVPSSFFLMDIPGYDGGEKGTLLYADASVNPNPSEEELADIAIASGNTAKGLLGWEPRVAILSFSTKGSAQHRDVCKVIHAGQIAAKKAKGMKIDAELQADSALVLSTAQKKIPGPIGEVAGRANVLIFPDLDAGNIAYKLTQILAKASAYGPVLQGFKKPLSDLSRGAKVEDIVGAIAIVAVEAK